MSPEAILANRGGFQRYGAAEPSKVRWTTLATSDDGLGSLVAF